MRFRGCYIENKEAERKGEEELTDKRVGNTGNDQGRCCRKSVTKEVMASDHGCRGSGGDLRDQIWNNICGGALAPDKDRERNAGVKMGTGDMTSGVDHGHQGTRDCQRPHYSLCATQDNTSDGENQKERTDEFIDVFSHGAMILEIQEAS